jgi:hypothetical protein
MDNNRVQKPSQLVAKADLNLEYRKVEMSIQFFGVEQFRVGT